MSILSLIDSRSLPSKLSAEFSEYFNVKSGLLDKSFDLSSVDDISSEGLDRLTEVSRMLGDSTSEELKTANSYKTNSSSLTSYLESQNFIDNSGQILDSTGNPLEVDGEVPTVDSYESLKIYLLIPILILFLPNLLRMSHLHLLLLSHSSLQRSLIMLFLLPLLMSMNLLAEVLIVFLLPRLRSTLTLLMLSQKPSKSLLLLLV